MEGTLKRNNVLEPMSPYGCHSDNAPTKFKEPLLTNGRVVWPHRMSVECRYDKALGDIRCGECKHRWDSAYVEGLK